MPAASVSSFSADATTPQTCGVVLVNLGTPTAPNAPALRRYLREFLSDPRVIELPRAVWLPVLYGAILPWRAGRSAAAYRRIWTEQGSPLRFLSEALGAEVASALGAETSGVAVRLAMRYGEPSVAQVLRELRDAGLQRLIVLPLYPQYSASTTASVFDAVSAELGRWRRIPELRFVADYHARPDWLDAVAATIRASWEKQPRGEKLLFSFHGIPQRYVRNGDPYEAQCRASTAAIAARLALADDAWQICYQSRVGREPWLQPYTDTTIKALAQSGVTRLDVVCPGFAVDCLETLEEIAMQNAELFETAGGKHLHYIPALNDTPAHAAALARLIRDHGAGWPEFSGDRTA